MRKRISVSVLSVIFAAMCVFGLAACAERKGGNGNENGNTVDTTGFQYALNGDEASYAVTGIGTVTDNEIVIPAKYNDMPVTAIGDSAFSGCSNLKSITMSDSVVSIGNQAFSGCTELTAVSMPLYLKSIGDGAFGGCGKLENITLPSSVTDIGLFAFIGCDSLQYNHYEDAEYLGNPGNPYLALIKASDSDITSCTVHAQTKFIYDSAFMYCGSLTSINLGAAVTKIGYSAFEGCSSLTSITIPSMVTSISDFAFRDCGELASVTLPVSLTSIGDGAFYNCLSLKNVTYKGSEEQWQTIAKGESWNVNTHEDFTVTCNDVVLSKEER